VGGRAQDENNSHPEVMAGHMLAKVTFSQDEAAEPRLLRHACDSLEPRNLVVPGRQDWGTVLC